MGRRVLDEANKVTAEAITERDEKIKRAFLSTNKNESTSTAELIKPLTTTSRNISTSSLNSITSSSTQSTPERWDKYCIVLKDFPSDMHDFARNNIVTTKFMYDTGGSGKKG